MKTAVIATLGVLVAGAVSGAAAAAEWSVRAVRVETAPVIDGTLEDIWFRGEPASGFREFRPALGRPAMKDTEVYILYDDQALYVAWVCYEDNLGGLVASATVRDMSMNDDDAIDLLLDANNDRQSAYDFMVNWRGVEYDGTLAKDGAAGGPAWDGSWETATSVGDAAWYCEMAIPWATLRYDRKTGSFGIQFLRFRKAVFEETFWAGGGELINRVSTFGRVTGFEDLPAPRPLEVTPYVTARAEERNNTGYYNLEASDGWELEPRYGLDLSLRAGAAATVLATVLPDYAYIEADPAQISLAPTEIWLAEKRPFFTEGYELFDTESEMLYTRRLTEIAAGVKVTGRRGPIRYGVLDAALRDDDPLYPEDNFAVVRAVYDAFGGSSFGVMGIGREELGGEVPLDVGSGADRARYNNVALGDGTLVLPARLIASFEAATAATAGDGGDGYLYNVSLGRVGVTDNVFAWYGETGEEFRADMSFLQPEDLGVREVGGFAQREIQLNRGGVRSLSFHGNYEHKWNLSAETTNNFTSLVVRVTSENDYFVTLNYRGGRDLRYVAMGYPVYDNDVWDVAAGHTPASWGNYRLGYWRGMWYGDFYHYYTFEFNAIPTPALVFDGNVEVGNRRPGERFVVGNLKVTHNVTDELYWRVIVLGNSDERTSEGSILWGWDFRPDSTAYLAYEQRRDSTGHFALAEQLAFVKVSYAVPF